MSISFDEFKDKATKILDINLSGYKLKRVQRRTDSLMRRHNINDYTECLTLLKTDQDFKEAYINHFTINTSEFYRNPENFTYLQKEILPKLLKTQNKIKIWSAPCSNGSEPYTLAIILRELGYTEKNYKILASDLDSNILDVAREGIFNTNSIANVPDKILKKYFTPLPDNSTKYKIDPDIINSIIFEQKDLIKEPFSNNWDIILSRNFFIYLTREVKDILSHKFTAALRPGGYFFLGNTEFIFNPECFDLKKIYSSFYQKTS